MRKRISFILAAVMCIAVLGLFGSGAQAASRKTAKALQQAGAPSATVFTAVVTAENGLNIRSAMNLDNQYKLTAAPKNAVVSVLSREANGWYKIQYLNRSQNKIYVGYMKGTTYLADNPDVLVTTADLRLRSTRSTENTDNVLTVMNTGTSVEVIERLNSTWYYVNCKGKIGYCNPKYLAKPAAGKTIDLKDVEFEDITVYYDTKEHELPKVSNLPDGVKVEYSTTAKHKDVGDYVVKATFKPVNAADKLVNAEEMTASLSIKVKEGAVYRTKTLRLKVTNPNIRGKGTVMITGPVEKTMKKVSVAKSIKIGGVSFAVTEIGKKAFYKNTKLAEVVVPETVEVIQAGAFAGCTSLRKADLGKGLKEIGKSAFKGDKKLMSLIIRSKVLAKVGAKAFVSIPEEAVINVPNNRVSRYKKLFAGKGLQEDTVIK